MYTFDCSIYQYRRYGTVIIRHFWLWISHLQGKHPSISISATNAPSVFLQPPPHVIAQGINLILHLMVVLKQIEYSTRISQRIRPTICSKIARP